MRRVSLFCLIVIVVTALANHEREPVSELAAEEETLRAAGISTAAPALLEFFHERSKSSESGDKLLTLARKLGDPNGDVRAKASVQLIACGPSAISALRHVVNDCDDPTACENAKRCLDWLEGTRRSEVPIAAARVLAAAKADGAAQALLTYLPFVDDKSVLDAVKTALLSLARKGERPEPALIRALRDPVPLRRAIAAEVLASGGQPDVLPELRKLLADPKPLVRLKAALALTERREEAAIPVLIDLLAELPIAERRQVEETLNELAGEWSPRPTLAGDDDVSRKIRRDVWAAWWRNTDGPSLIAAFRKGTLEPEGLAGVLTLIEKLGDKAFIERERAVAELTALGNKVVPLLRNAEKSPDPERARRATICIAQIVKLEDKHRLPIAAARLLAIRKPDGACGALLGYLPFSDDEMMRFEIGKTLKHFAAEATLDPALFNALSDKLPIRRIAAAEALAGGGGSKHFAAVRKLLTDSEAEVRLAAAMALAFAFDKEAVPALIDLVAELPRAQTWRAEEILLRLAGEKAPANTNDPSLPGYRQAWQKWWTKNGETVDLAQLKAGPAAFGFTLVLETFIKGKGAPKVAPAAAAGGKKGANPPVVANPLIGSDRLVELDRNGSIRLKIEDLGNPIDVQRLPGERFLIAEGRPPRVTERDATGKILWEVKNLTNTPVNVQRLANGDTFIAIYNGILMDVDKTGKTVFSVNISLQPGMVQLPPPGPIGGGFQPAFGGVFAARKLADGGIVCLTTQNTCVWLDGKGKELKSFRLATGLMTQGALDVTPKGNVLITENDNTAREYTPDGKVVAQVSFPGMTSATRLANGNTLVACSGAAAVVELDNNGRVVWRYDATGGYRPMRARRQR